MLAAPKKIYRYTRLGFAKLFWSLQVPGLVSHIPGSERHPVISYMLVRMYLEKWKVEDFSRRMDDLACLNPKFIHANHYKKLIRAARKKGCVDLSHSIARHAHNAYPESRALYVSFLLSSIKSSKVEDFSLAHERLCNFEDVIKCREYRLVIKNLLRSRWYSLSDTYLKVALEQYPERKKLLRLAVEVHEKAGRKNEIVSVIESNPALNNDKLANGKLAVKLIKAKMGLISSAKDTDEIDALIQDACNKGGESEVLREQAAKLYFYRAKRRWWKNHAYQLSEWDGEQLSYSEWVRVESDIANLLMKGGETVSANRKIADVLVETKLMCSAVLYQGKSPMQALIKNREILHLIDKFDSVSKRNLFSNMLAAIESNNSNHSYDIKLLQEIEQLPPSCFDVWQWLKLERLLAFNGLLVASLAVRNKAKKLAIEEFLLSDGVSFTPYKMAFLAAIENSDFALAVKVINHLKFEGEVKELGKSYLALVQGKPKDFYSSIRKNFSDQEKKFYDCVNGKSLAIVGPAPSALESGDEIDDFDQALRINFIKLQSGHDTKKSGSKTNITSFNIERVLAEQLRGNLGKIEGVDWVIAKRKFSQAFLPSESDLVVRHKHRFYGDYSFSGTINHIPDLSLYLLPYGFSRIKYFNMNFFCSSRAYDKGYRELGANILNVVWGKDNLIAGLALSRNLYRGGYLECDDMSREVLEMTNLEYMQAMEKYYAPSGVFKS